MLRYLIVGAGRQGTAAAYFLGKFCGATDTLIVFIDEDENRAIEAYKILMPLLHDKKNVDFYYRSEELLKNKTELEKYDVLISALPSRFNKEMIQIALEAGLQYCDYGFDENVVRQQKSEFESMAKAQNLGAIVNCGIEPGLAYNIALGIARELEPDTVKISVGGNPINSAINTLRYQKAFDGVAYEYSGKITVLEGGRLIQKVVPSESEKFWHETPNGPEELEEFYAQTSFGLVAESLQKIGVINASAKTIRWPDHYTIIRGMHEVGLFKEDLVCLAGTSVSPLKLTSHLLNTSLPWVKEDFLIMKILFRKNGKVIKRVSMDVQYDKNTGLTAMQQATSAPVAVVAKLLANKALSSGVYVQEEAVNYKYMIRELEKMGFEIKITDF